MMLVNRKHLTGSSYKEGHVHRRHIVALMSLIAALSLTPLPAAQQAVAQTSSTSAWTPPRTADGRPDLQGVWLSSSATPLERPLALAGRERLTDEEVATLRERAHRIFRNGRSAFATPEGAFLAALANVETYEAQSTSSSIGMVDIEFDNRTSLVVDPPEGRIPPLTPAGRQREAAVDEAWEKKTGPEDFNTIHRCITTGVPRLGGNFGAGPYSYYQIMQTPGYVAVISEAFHDARLIPLDGRPHVPERIRQWNGDSRGRWEGDTLVVETRNFSSKSFFRGATDGLHLVERFTRTAPNRLTYRVTVADPTTWVAPWTAEVPLKRMDQPIYEFACHEGNYSIVGMLRTARLEEERAATAGGR
jgi:hypothetical protein